MKFEELPPGTLHVKYDPSIVYTINLQLTDTRSHPPYPREGKKNRIMLVCMCSPLLKFKKLQFSVFILNYLNEDVSEKLAVTVTFL